MELLHRHSRLQEEAEFDLPPPGISRENRAAIDNPVVLVQESKDMLFDICSVLFGVTPENFYAHYDGKSDRRSWYYRKKKGIFGHNLGCIGVVEDHAKGTLHYHLLFFGGLSPYVLQRFVRIKEVVESLKKTLDSMYSSVLPDREHLRGLMQQILKEGGPLSEEAKQVIDKKDFNCIVQRSEPLFENREQQHPTYQNLGVRQHVESYTHRQRHEQQMHKHSRTCHKGAMGITGCRLCMPCASCPETHPVKLVLPEHKPSQTSSNNVFVETVGDSDSDSDSDLEDYINTDEAQPEGNNEDAPLPSYTVKAIHPVEQDHPNYDKWMKWQPRHAYERDTAKRSAVVWETKRPTIESILLQASQQGVPRSRENIIDELQKALGHYEEYDQNSSFWVWLKQCSDENIFLLYDKLLQDLLHRNGMVSVHNTVLSYCTGSHNNCQMLGTVVQSKSA